MAETIDIEVRSILTVKKIMGTGSIMISLPKESTLIDLFDVLVARWGDDLRKLLFQPGTSRLWPHMHIMINGRHFAFTGRMETPLKNGDSILIMPPAGGG
jgi:molybdopterin synthase sulfur carrier subunit